MGRRLKEKWVFNTKEEIACEPLIIDSHIENKAKILLATKNGKIFLLNREGETEWTFESKEENEDLFVDSETANSINNKPVIVHDKKEDRRKIIFGSENSNLYCLNSQGELLWKLKTDGPIRGSPQAVINNKETYILCASHDGYVYVCDLNGKIMHQANVGIAIETAPTYTKGLIIIGTVDGDVVALNHGGGVVWRFHTDNKISARVIATKQSDGKDIVLVASQDYTLYALTLQGEELWRYKTGGAILAPATVTHIDEEKQILFGSCDNSIYCLDEEGELLWSFETEFWVATSPIINRREDQLLIIVGSYDHYVYIFDGEGSYELDYIPGLAGVVNQSTFQATSFGKEAGTSKGKLIGKYRTDGYIVGCALIDDADEILVTTKKGKLYNLKF